MLSLSFDRLHSARNAFPKILHIQIKSLRYFTIDRRQCNDPRTLKTLYTIQTFGRISWATARVSDVEKSVTNDVKKIDKNKKQLQ